MKGARVWVTAAALAAMMAGAAEPQDPKPKDPFTLRDGLTIARRVASKWDRKARFVQCSFVPVNLQMLGNGKHYVWRYVFATPSKIEAGRLRTATVAVAGDVVTLRNAKEIVSGFAVEITEGDMDGPLPADLGDGFADSDRVLKETRKLGFENLADYTRLWLEWDRGGTCWIGVMQNTRYVLDAKTMKEIFRGTTEGRDEILAAYSKGMSVDDAWAAVKKDVAEWDKKEAEETKLIGFGATALSARRFATGADVDLATVELHLTLERPRMHVVEVVNKNVKWMTRAVTDKDQPRRFENVVALDLAGYDGKKLSEAMKGHAKLQEWLAAGDGRAAVKFTEPGKLSLEFEDAEGKREKLALVWKLETSTLE